MTLIRLSDSKWNKTQSSAATLEAVTILTIQIMESSTTPSCNSVGLIPLLRLTVLDQVIDQMNIVKINLSNSSNNHSNRLNRTLLKLTLTFKLTTKQKLTNNSLISCMWRSYFLTYFVVNSRQCIISSFISPWTTSLSSWSSFSWMMDKRDD